MSLLIFPEMMQASTVSWDGYIHSFEPMDFSARLESFLKNYNISYHLISGWDDPWTGVDRGYWMCALTTPIFLDRK